MSLPTKDEIKSRFEQLPLSGDPHLDVHGRMVVTELLPYKKFDELYPAFVPQFGNDPDSGKRQASWKAFQHLIKVLEGHIEFGHHVHRTDTGKDAPYLHQALLQFGQANSNGLFFPPGGPGISQADLITILTRYGFWSTNDPGFYPGAAITRAAVTYKKLLRELYHEVDYASYNEVHLKLLQRQRHPSMNHDDVMNKSVTWEPMIPITMPVPARARSPALWGCFDRLCQILKRETDRCNNLSSDDMEYQFTRPYADFYGYLRRSNPIAVELNLPEEGHVLGSPFIETSVLYRLAYYCRIVGWPGGDESDVGRAVTTYMKAINNATNVLEDYPSGREAQTLRDIVNLASIAAGRIPLAEPAPLEAPVHANPLFPR